MLLVCLSFFDELLPSISYRFRLSISSSSSSSAAAAAAAAAATSSSSLSRFPIEDRISIWFEDFTIEELVKFAKKVGGRGCVKDEMKAFEWHKKAAEQGNLESHVALVMCHQNGISVDTILIGVVFPSSLLFLSFGSEFNQSLVDVQFPAFLQSLSWLRIQSVIDLSSSHQHVIIEKLGGASLILEESCGYS